MMRIGFWLAVTCAWCGVWSTALRADSGTLRSLIASSRATFTPLAPDLLSGAKIETMSAIQNVNASLSTLNDYDAKHWRRYLGLDATAAEIAKDKLDLQNGRKPLEATLAALYQPYEGMENPAFLRLRESLAKLVSYMKLADGTYGPREYQAKLEELQKLVDAEGAGFSPAQLRELAAIYGWLLDAGQAPALTEELRREYANANVQLRLGRLDRFVLFNDNRVEPVNEYMFGSQVTGQTQSQSWATLVFAPNYSTADLRIQVQGFADTFSTAHRALVDVNTYGRTNLLAWKQFGFNGSDFLVYPAQAYCTSVSSVDSVDGGPIASWIAGRRAQRMQPDAAAYMSQKANAQLTAQLDQKVNDILGKLNGKFHKLLGDPLQRLGFSPILSSSASTADQVNVNLFIGRPRDLAAPLNVPSFTAPLSDIDVTMHESSLNNSLDVFLGGVDFAGRDLVKLLQLLTGTVPGELQATGAQDWSVLFSPTVSLQVHFLDGNRLALDAGFQKLVHGESESKGGSRLHAEYALESNGQGVTLRRVGDVRIDYDKTVDPGMRAFFDKTARLVLRSELPIDLTRMENSSVKLGLTAVQTTGGWLHLGAQILSLSLTGQR